MTAKPFVRLLTVLAVAAAAVFLAGVPASAAVQLRGHLQNWQTGACLDSNARGSVYTLPCQQGNLYQTWIMDGPLGHVQNGYDRWRFQNAATGLCLIYDGSFGDTFQAVSCGPANDTIISEQALEANGPSWSDIQIRMPLNNVCLDTHGVGEAYASDCNYGPYQTWRLI